MSKVRTRYAPSPTGVPHIGNLRTALFNFLFAKNQKGGFILRIEDTDQKRSTKEHITDIENSLDVLGLKYDNKFLQSQRLDIYHKYLEALKNKGLASEDEGAWRFKIDTKTKSVLWKDSVHGEVSFPTGVIEDFIIVKSDGFPTYHFASVVDDHEMEITHVIRGDEWISSTPKHLLLYKAFGWQHPDFSHVPPILGHDKKKLSKREGAKSAMEYIKGGYLAEALVNYLALLGWSPKNNQEIFTMDELTREFSLERLNKNNPIFDIKKLKWISHQWIKKLEPKVFDQRIQQQFPNKYDPAVTQNIAPLVQSRISTIADFSKLAEPFYQEPTLTNELVKAVPLSGVTINQYAEKLKSMNDWTPDSVKSGTVSFAQENNVETKDIYRSLGVATFGSLVTPPLPDSVAELGKEVTIKRLGELSKKKK